MRIEDVPGAWRPEPVEDEEVLDPRVGAAAAGLWDQPPPGDDLPPLWHWFHFLGWPAQHRLGRDGHLADGDLLPPIEDRRRMFAGGTWRRDAPLRYGRPVRRRRSVEQVTPKSGRSGELLFVTVRTSLTQDDRLCQVEDQTIVYRSGPSSVDLRGTDLATTAPTVPTPADGPSLPLLTDPALLFRMSALTGNLHRIHYDHPYVVDVEHYPGLVVHGPLLVLHMAEVLRRDPRAPEPDGISFRLLAPAFVGEPLVAVTEPEPVDGGDPGSVSLRVASAREASHASLRATTGTTGTPGTG